MSMTVSTRNGPTGEINVTPLIDVLLVLLIIFMVILPPHSQGELAQIPLQATETPAVNPPEPIVIQLKDGGNGGRPLLSLNRETVKWEELEPRLQALYRERSDRVGFVKGDPEVEFVFVAEVLDITHRAGAERVGLLGKN